MLSKRGGRRRVTEGKREQKRIETEEEKDKKLKRASGLAGRKELRISVLFDHLSCGGSSRTTSRGRTIVPFRSDR